MLIHNKNINFKNFIRSLRFPSFVFKIYVVKELFLLKIKKNKIKCSTKDRIHLYRIQKRRTQ